jgi:hypothetical protein
MDYKRQLGHRVVPRTPFLALLEQHGGAFRRPATPLQPCSSSSSSSSLASADAPGSGGVASPGRTVAFEGLADGDKCDFENLI